MVYKFRYAAPEAVYHSPAQPQSLVVRVNASAVYPSLDELLRRFRTETQVAQPLLTANSRFSGVFQTHPHDAWENSWNSGRRYMTQARFRVRSKAEKIITDFLVKSDLRFVYEPPLLVANVFMRPDFYLTDYDLPYEHFGFTSADYLHDAELKIATYYRAGVPFMYTTFNDETDIEDVIVDKLAEATLDL
jgi:hypothetical protein